MTGKVDDFVELIKGRSLPPGSIRTHGGVKKRKTADGKWIPVKGRRKYKIGDTRTKDGKRYRLSDDGKWKRVKSRKRKQDSEIKDRKLRPERRKVEALSQSSKSEYIEDMKRKSIQHPRNNNLKKNIDFVSRPEYVDDVHLPKIARQYLATAYAVINAVLRSGNDEESMAEVSEKHDIDIQELKSLVSAAVTEIPKYMSPLQSDYRTYRGLDLGGLKIEAGSVLPMSSFVSMSTDETLAGEFVADTLLNITIPTGTSALVTNVGEREVLLPPDKYRLKVESVTHSDNVQTVHCSVVKS